MSIVVLDPRPLQAHDPGSPALVPASWLTSHLSSRRQGVNAFLEKSLEGGVRYSDELRRVMHHAAIGSGGKRLRPLLTILAAEACGERGEVSLPCACAMEFIHACSLIQDDLPAMDNDRMRRGQPTCHVKFGEGLTILAGDALLSLAFELMATPSADLPATRQLSVIQLIARSIGLNGMAGGQAADLLAANAEVSLEALRLIHEGKTAAFLQACIVAGGLIAGAAAWQLDALRTFGAEIGLAFQIVDDILNETGNETATGKAVGSDRALGKASFPAAYGVEGSRRLALEALNRGLEALDPLGPTSAPLQEVGRFIVARNF